MLTRLLPRAGAFDMGVTDFGVCETMAFVVGRFFYEGSVGSGSSSGTHVTIFRLERDRWVIRSQVFRPEPVPDAVDGGGPAAPGEEVSSPEAPGEEEADATACDSP